MIGGLKSVSRAALVAGAVSLGSFGAHAADFGGNCCADLEERVAELEATTARKGNRVMSLTISGQVGAQVIWHDSDAEDAYRADEITIDGDEGEYTSSLTFSGEAKVSSDLAIGFKMDFDVDDDTTVATDDLFLFVRSATLGAVQLGRIDAASDGVHAISLGGVIGQMSATEAGAFVGDGFLLPTNFDGDDADPGIKYISPTIAGFIFSASFQNAAVATDEEDERWSVALRYAGEFGPIRIAAGIGYEEQDDAIDDNSILVEDTEWVVAGSIMHTPTGLFLNAAYGEFERDSAVATEEIEDSGWSITAGIEQKFFAVGKTSIYGKFQRRDRDLNGGDVVSLTSDNFGFGIIQDVDAAASQLYVKWDQYECVGVAIAGLGLDGDTCVDDVNVVSAGMLVKF
ncbi:MAG: hypothetical protein AAFQ45_06765 [Pseudomonadota bacterium]